jgi:hypothetical protein
VIGYIHGGRHRLIILGGGGANLTMRAFNLRASQVRKMGKIGLTYVFNFFFSCLYTTQIIVYKYFYSGRVHMLLVVDRVTLGQIFLRVLRGLPSVLFHHPFTVAV